MTEILVIGAGPAGLAAATELRRQGVGPVTLLEREGEPGGIPRHCGHSPFGLREFQRLLSGRAYAARLTAAAQAAGVDLRLRHSVVAIAPDLTTSIATPDGLAELRPQAILLATGTRETTRAARLVPGQRPLGILTTGALQDHVYLRGLIPFRRPLIVGSELVTMSAILTCRFHGIRPVALIDDEPGPRIGQPIGLFPHLTGLPVHYRTSIADIFGTPRVEAVLLRHADGTTRRIACDGILFTGRFTAESSLARAAGLRIEPGYGGPAVDAAGRTPAPGIWAAGNLVRGLRTAGQCWAEGRRTARALAEALRSGHHS